MNYEVKCQIFQIKRKSINKKDTHKSGSTLLLRMILFSNNAIINNVGIAQTLETLGY